MSRGAFWLKNNKYNLCLKSDATGAACEEPPSLDMLWIRTNGKLMNAKTLKCIQRQEIMGKRVIMKQCETNGFQKMWCKMENSNMQIGWKVNLKWHLYISTNKLGQTYANSSWVVFPNRVPEISWSSNENSCKNSEKYKGIVYKIDNILYTAIFDCLNLINILSIWIGFYRFSDGSFMKYLNYSQKNVNLSVYAPIFKEHYSKCQVKELTSYDWKSMISNESNVFAIEQKDENEIVLEVMSEYRSGSETSDYLRQHKIL